MAKIIYANGKEKVVHPENGTDFSLKEMQTIVGGYIEIVTDRNGDYLVCNEEGKLMGLPINHKASMLFGAMMNGDILVASENELK